jgi:hypothetical protein
MSDLMNKTNSQLVVEAKEIANAYEALKSRILSDIDKLTEYEIKFAKINAILKERNV